VQYSAVPDDDIHDAVADSGRRTTASDDPGDDGWRAIRQVEQRRVVCVEQLVDVRVWGGWAAERTGCKQTGQLVEAEQTFRSQLYVTPSIGLFCILATAAINSYHRSNQQLQT